MAAFIVLLGIGLIIGYFSKESKISLQNILFWVGTIPIVVSSLGFIGNYTGALNPSNRFDRPLIEQSLKDRIQKSEMHLNSGAAVGLNWMIAGFLIWAVSYFV